MTTLVPREPYSKEELEKLYPKELQLQLVQVVRDETKHFFPGRVNQAY
jgi:acid phosphatase